MGATMMAGQSAMQRPAVGLRQQRAAALRAEAQKKVKSQAQTVAQPSKARGADYHHVKSGETLESIAKQHGQAPRAVWAHPLNKQLRDRVGSPHAMGVGEALFIPALEEQPPDRGPVGQGEYTVQSSDCISSIAKRTGHYWKKIWDDGQNSELREARKEPNVLLPGDRVCIPEIRPKQEPGETEMRHRFVRKGEPAILRMQIKIDDEPVANAPFHVRAGGRELAGTTDAEGRVQLEIPGDADGGKLLVAARHRMLMFPLSMGRIDPVSESSGVQARLNNLGYRCGKLDGVLGPRTRAALMKFQAAADHPDPNGELDEQTRILLREEHGS